MVQVVEGPVAAAPHPAPRGFEPRSDRSGAGGGGIESGRGAAAPRRGGYQGSPEARGFARKPRFSEDES